MFEYNEYRIIYKYLYNGVHYDVFKEALLAAVPHASSDYIHEKWQFFQRDMAGFTATFDEKFYNKIISNIKETQYRG